MQHSKREPPSSTSRDSTRDRSINPICNHSGDELLKADDISQAEPSLGVGLCRHVSTPQAATKVVPLPRLVFHLAGEDRGDKGEDEQRDLQLARLDEHLNRGVAGEESSKIRKQHADCRRREHVECKLPLLGLNELCELGRNLAEGENPIDIPARARDTPSLVRSARAVDAERAKYARTQRGVR